MLPKVIILFFLFQAGPLQVLKISYDPFCEVFRQDPPKVGGTFADELLIMCLKSAANFCGVSAEDRFPVQITCFTTLALSSFCALFDREPPAKGDLKILNTDFLATAKIRQISGVFLGAFPSPLSAHMVNIRPNSLRQILRPYRRACEPTRHFRDNNPCEGV